MGRYASLSLKIVYNLEIMTNIDSICPVPKAQRPIEEFIQLTNSWFFSWPMRNKLGFYKILFITWLILLPIALTISNGSIYLKHHLLQSIIISVVSSILLPIFLVTRQLLGWNYVLKRLQSEKVEYEETGWYDGQVWEKPLDWREQDLLVANYEIKPIISLLKRTLSKSIALLFIGIIIYAAL